MPKSKPKPEIKMQNLFNNFKKVSVEVNLKQREWELKQNLQETCQAKSSLKRIQQ